MAPRRIAGVEKHYDWGDQFTIRHTLGLPHEPGTKVAELWFGTHPQGPSRFHDGTSWRPLTDITGEMTMLVKLLACAQPLSLQTHPTVEQAREGFAREEALGIPRDAPERMYRDESDKPEQIIALSRFEALCGFAPVDESVSFLRSIRLRRAASVLEQNGIRHYLEWAFRQPRSPRFLGAPQWLRRLRKMHPNDRALWVAPLLNHVVLEEGQSLSLPAGNLHAYIRGFGLEVMKSSDNVIRAGFTTKHVDVPELLRIVDTTPLLQPLVTADAHGHYPSPSGAFSVATLENVNEHVDRHRIVYGRLGNWDNSGPVLRHPEIVFIEAGTRADIESMYGWVCTQL